MAWTSLTSFTGNPAPVATDGTLIFLIDQSGTEHLWAYDPGTDTYDDWGAVPNPSGAWGTGILSWVPDFNGTGPAIIRGDVDATAAPVYVAVLDVFQPVSNAGTWSSLTPDALGFRDMYAYGFTPDIGTYGSIIVAGGYTSASDTDDVRLYDVDTDAWSALAPIPAAHGELQGAWVDGMFYVFGGWNDGGGIYEPVGYVYDPGLDSWTTITVPFDSDTAGYPAVAALSDGRILVAGGYGDNQTALARTYEPDFDTWAGIDALPFADYCTAVAIGNDAYVLEWDSPGQLVVESFGPTTYATAGSAAGTGTAYGATITALNTGNAAPSVAAGTGAALGPSITLFSPPPALGSRLRRWVFTDPSNGESYMFDVNPNAGGTPQSKRNMTTQKTTAGGKIIYFEGSLEPQTFEWSGVLLDEVQYQAYADWYNKKHQIYVTDDLERTYSIYIISFEPKRERARQHLFKHSYTAKAVLLDWT